MVSWYGQVVCEAMLPLNTTQNECSVLIALNCKCYDTWVRITMMRSPIDEKSIRLTSNIRYHYAFIILING